ncbi:MAG: hypothetical protein K8S14_01555 [Actinomycetia bacterium]|nr:hypothetical protein [Actinomycetes bacterium]
MSDSSNGICTDEKNNPFLSSGPILAGVGSEPIAPGWKAVLPYGKQTGTDTFYNKDIFVKAIVIRVGELEVAIIEADVIGIVFEAAQTIKAHISRESGIPSDNIILGAVHNHSYPRLKDKKIINLISEQSAKAVNNARINMFPAMIGAMTRTMPQNLSINRSRASGMVNSDLTVIRIDDTAGHVRAVIFNCGIHPTCFTTSWNDEKTGMIGPEWPEYVRRQVSFYLASGNDCRRRDASLPYAEPFTMFTLGAAGDQQASLWLDETQGNKMSALKVFTDTIAREVLNMVDWIITDPIVRMTFSWKQIIIDILSRDKIRGERETLVQFLSINDMGFLAIPGELVYCPGREIVRFSPSKHTMLITCANDYLPGYIVSEGEALEQITFESKDWRNPPELGPIILEAAAGLLNPDICGTSASIPEGFEFGCISGNVRCGSSRRFVVGVMNKIEEPSSEPPFWGKRAEVEPDGKYLLDKLLPGEKFIYVKEVAGDYSGRYNQDIRTIAYGIPAKVLQGGTIEVNFEFPPDLYYSEVKSIELKTLVVEKEKCKISGRVKIAGTLRIDEKIEARLYYAGIKRYTNLLGNLQEKTYLNNPAAVCMVDDEGRFKFTEVPSGSYTIGFWLDINRNGIIEPGVDIISALSGTFII